MPYISTARSCKRPGFCVFRKKAVFLLLLLSEVIVTFGKGIGKMKAVIDMAADDKRDSERQV